MRPSRPSCVRRRFSSRFVGRCDRASSSPCGCQHIHVLSRIRKIALNEKRSFEIDFVLQSARLAKAKHGAQPVVLVRRYDVWVWKRQLRVSRELVQCLVTVVKTRQFKKLPKSKHLNFKIPHDPMNNFCFCFNFIFIFERSIVFVFLRNSHFKLAAFWLRSLVEKTIHSRFLKLCRFKI